MSRVRPARGAASRRSGRRAEVPAALWLMAKGYRILGLRLRTPLAAIDRLGLRGKIRSLVEAERRTSLPIARQSVARASVCGALARQLWPGGLACRLFPSILIL